MTVDGEAQARAAAGMRRLHAFYNPETGLWDNANDPASPTHGWWNSANVLETTIDYMNGTGDDTYDAVIANTYEKTHANMVGSKYFDDEGWWALTWIKAWQRTQDKRYLDAAEAIFDDMCGAWDYVCRGGIWWDRVQTKKNAIANELFLSVAARLNLHAGGGNAHGTYLQLAQRAWDWFARSGMIDPARNLVQDDLGPDCKVNSTAIWTYNQGVILGGLLALREATQDDALLVRARAIADATLRPPLVDRNGIIVENTGTLDENAAQFKGILVRNLVELHAATQETRYRDAIARNADSVWTNARNPADDALGGLWAHQFDYAAVSRQSAAMDALNGAVLLA